MKRKGLILWVAWALVLLLVIVFSCVSQPVFAEQYREFLNYLILPQQWRRYLLSHYKLGHPLWYAILAVFTYLCFKRLLFSLLLIISLGGILEIVQLFLPTRTASWTDLFYDLIGTLAGLLLVSVVNLLRRLFRPRSI